MIRNDFVEVVKANEIAEGKKNLVEVEGKEALIANVDGKFYAISDRCGHMNALLSMGNLTGSTVMTM
jgi:nitrite reductase/ring-hydroxylating ferredoxin subunit